MIRLLSTHSLPESNILSLFKKWLQKSPSSSTPSAATDHGIKPELIKRNALKVLQKLEEAGYSAYLVGGGVRDLLLGITPKDFDVATNAHPEEIRKVFRNSRLIGRRFRLAHVFFHDGIIEVATFRGRAEQSSADHHTSETGMILRDNVYGSIEDDAIRRDFTINALYYSYANNSVLDFTNGMADLKARLIRMIGDPVQRYHEDPVRMLRALRLAAKLDCQIEAASEKPISELSGLLLNVPGARLLEEIIKVYNSGKSAKGFQLLREHGLFAVLFPQTEAHLLENPIFQNLLQLAFSNADERINQQKTLHPAFMFGILLWPPLQAHIEKEIQNGMKFFPALQQAEQLIIHKQNKSLQIPRRIMVSLREIWTLQYRLSQIQRYQSRVFALASHPRFRAAYDFLLLRAKSGDTSVQEMATWWTDFQAADEAQQHRMTHLLRRRRHKKPHDKKE